MSTIITPRFGLLQYFSFNGFYLTMANSLEVYLIKPTYPYNIWSNRPTNVTMLDMILQNVIADILTNATKSAQQNGGLPAVSQIDVLVERPQNRDHGDFATSLPLKLAKSMHMNPVDIATQIAKFIIPQDPVKDVWVEPPGFINFSLSPGWLSAQVQNILAEADLFGNIPLGNEEQIQVEFVSVNPTGPIHVGHARGAVLGDALANILEAANYRVTREYYFNDAGNQMINFYNSLFARYKQSLGQQEPMPESGYMGQYMTDMAMELSAIHGDKFLSISLEDGKRSLGQIGLDMMLMGIKDNLNRLRVNFDVWFKEHTLFEQGQYDKALNLLREGDYLVVRDGATWLTSTALGEDKDNVLIRGSGMPTYFAADIAYHYNKFLERKFSRVINIWGADHQGHISRMKTAIQALGIEPDRLTIITHQMIAVKSNGQSLRASKRTGDIITLEEILDEVGADACRYFFLARSPESQMEFDLSLAKKESSENPVYYIQYAHARTASILQLAHDNNIDYMDGNVSLLTDPAEQSLINKMLTLPELIESMAKSLEPHHLPHFSQELATSFHWFYQQCRVISSDDDDLEITRARLKLVQASGNVLRKCLSLMGMTAPVSM